MTANDPSRSATNTADLLTYCATAWIAPGQINQEDAARTAYLLGQSDSEPERLIRQTAMHREETLQLLDRAGLGPGERALDLGCGPLGILDQLAERVGGGGKVIGLEREESFRQHAATTVHAQGLANVSVIGGDARKTKLPSNYFDFSHARLLLVNLRRPQSVVEELVRVTKPGGVIALHEVDWVSWTCEPMADSWIRLKRAARAVWQQNGLDVHIGRRLPEMLHRAGLQDVQVQPRTYAWYRGEQNHSLLLAILNRIRRDIIEHGLMEEAEVIRLEQELTKHLTDPNTMVLSPTYFRVWGRKPDTANSNSQPRKS
jgi:ubiquinone/menaquinone biosynthesis C-methylase UbiE